MIRVFPQKTKLTPKGEGVRIWSKRYPATPEIYDLDRSTPIRISCVFSWDKKRAERLAEEWAVKFSDVELGGPAYDDPGGEFEPGKYLAPGAVITSRGCPKNCADYCLVPEREGNIRELEVKDGWNVLDNNLLSCSEPHLDKVFAMLGRQKRGIKFSGGLDAQLFREDHLERLNKIKIDELWFAADTFAALECLENVKRLLDLVELSIEKRRCYVLFDPRRETLSQAESRAKKVLEMGFLPMAQVYRGPNTKNRTIVDPDWRKLEKFWSRPGLYRRKS